MWPCVTRSLRKVQVSKTLTTIITSQPVLAQGMKEVLTKNLLDPSGVEIIIDKDSDYTVIKSHVGTVLVVDDPQLVMRAFNDGVLCAKAIVLGTSKAEVIEDAMASLMDNKWFIDPAFERQEEQTDLSLTTRQAEVLQMYSDGFTTDAIADVLGLSVETIRTHTKRILAKLNAQTRTHAVAIAVSQGHIHPPKT